MRLASTLALICLATFLGVAGAQAARRTPSNAHRQACTRRQHRKKKRLCPSSREHHTTKSSKTSAPVPAPAPTPVSATPSPPAAPACPVQMPLPVHMAGQTSIVGYVRVGGGPLLPASSCPPGVSSGGSVALETPAGQVLETQSVEAGRPYQFLVQPGGYQIVNTVCGENSPVTVSAGQQLQIEAMCNIP
jgi:hypothetical protein